MDDILNSPPEAERFRVGEMAIIIVKPCGKADCENCKDVKIGDEVEVIGVLDLLEQLALSMTIGEQVVEDYIIKTADGSFYAVQHNGLRRKRPPAIEKKDWMKMCNIESRNTTVPV
jgi:hypothetical protein